MLLLYLLWELDRPLQGPWEWQARPHTSCMHSSLHPCLLKSQSHAHNSAFPAREPDDLFSVSFCSQISILLVGSVDDRFISEGSDLILQNCTVSNVIKGEPRVFTSGMVSVNICPEFLLLSGMLPSRCCCDKHCRYISEFVGVITCQSQAVCLLPMALPLHSCCALSRRDTKGTF